MIDSRRHYGRQWSRSGYSCREHGVGICILPDHESTARSIWRPSTKQRVSLGGGATLWVPYSFCGRLLNNQQAIYTMPLQVLHARCPRMCIWEESESCLIWMTTFHPLMHIHSLFGVDWFRLRVPAPLSRAELFLCDYALGEPTLHCSVMHHIFIIASCSFSI